MAIQIQALAIGWQVYDMTHDPLALGMTGLAEAIPYIFTSGFSGLVADTKNKKYVFAVATTLLLVASVVLLSISSMSSERLIQIGTMPFYVAFAVVGLTRGFMGPALQSLWAEIIPKEEYTNAATWSGNTFNIAAVSGPALGGIVFGIFGALWANAAVCLFLMMALVAIMNVKYEFIPKNISTEPLRERLTAGIRFVFSRQVLVGAMTLDMFAVLFGGAIVMLPAIAKDVLHVGPEVVGILRAAPFVGSVIMGIFLAHYPPIHKTGIKLLVGVAGFGLCMIAFAFSRDYVVSFVLLALSGAFDNISMVIRGTIAQIFTPNEMRGRVSAVNGIFIGTSNEIGAYESGLAASILGLVPSVAFGGAMTLIIVGITTVFAKELRMFEISKKSEQST